MTLEVSRISRLAPTGPSLRRSPHFEVRCDEGTVRSSCGNSFCGGRSVLANPFEEGVFWMRVFVRLFSFVSVSVCRVAFAWLFVFYERS